MDKRNAALKYHKRKLGFFEKKIQAIKKKDTSCKEKDTSGKKMDKEKPLGEWDVSPSGIETG